MLPTYMVLFFSLWGCVRAFSLSSSSDTRCLPASLSLSFPPCLPSSSLPSSFPSQLSVFDSSPNSSRARSPGGKRPAAQRRSPTRSKPTKGESSPGGSRSEVEVGVPSWGWGDLPLSCPHFLSLPLLFSFPFCGGQSLHRMVDSLQEALSREQSLRSDLEIKLQVWVLFLLFLFFLCWRFSVVLSLLASERKQGRMHTRTQVHTPMQAITKRHAHTIKSNTNTKHHKRARRTSIG